MKKITTIFLLFASFSWSQTFAQSHQMVNQDSIRCDAYFSLIDWSYPDYPAFLKDSNRYEINDDPARWKKFLAYYQCQLKEVLNNYNPDMIWFDRDREHAAKVRKMILEQRTRWPPVETRHRLVSQ